MTVENPGKKLVQSYNVPISKVEQINLPIESVGVITHLLYQNPSIITGGIFGSRVDDEMNVDDSSDIDVAVILDEYTTDKMTTIDFKISKDYRRITDDNTQIHMCCLNKSIDHSLPDDDKGDFRDMVMDQFTVLKGSMTDIK